MVAELRFPSIARGLRSQPTACTGRKGQLGAVGKKGTPFLVRLLCSFSFCSYFCPSLFLSFFLSCFPSLCLSVFISVLRPSNFHQMLLLQFENLTPDGVLRCFGSARRFGSSTSSSSAHGCLALLTASAETHNLPTM